MTSCSQKLVLAAMLVWGGAGCVGASTVMRPNVAFPDGQGTAVALSGGGGGGSFGYQTQSDLWVAQEVAENVSVLGFAQGIGNYLFDDSAWSGSGRLGLLGRGTLEVVQETRVSWELGAIYSGARLVGVDEHLLGLVIGLPVSQIAFGDLSVYSNPSLYLHVVVNGGKRDFPIFTELNLPLGVAWRIMDHLTLMAEGAYHPGLNGGVGSVGLIGHF